MSIKIIYITDEDTEKYLKSLENSQITVEAIEESVDAKVLTVG